MNRVERVLVSLILVAVVVSLMIWGSSDSTTDYPSDSSLQVTPLVASWPAEGQAVPYFTPTPVQQASSVADQ